MKLLSETFLDMINSLSAIASPYIYIFCDAAHKYKIKKIDRILFTSRMIWTCACYTWKCFRVNPIARSVTLGCRMHLQIKSGKKHVEGYYSCGSWSSRNEGTLQAFNVLLSPICVPTSNFTYIHPTMHSHTYTCLQDIHLFVFYL